MHSHSADVTRADRADGAPARVPHGRPGASGRPASRSWTPRRKNRAVASERRAGRRPSDAARQIKEGGGVTGQDWLEKDFYAVLGVPKDADAATIKKAYRKLAREMHPDHNPGDAKAEARFKDVGEAYAVLSDPEQRGQYDQLRAMAGGAAVHVGRPRRRRRLRGRLRRHVRRRRPRRRPRPVHQRPGRRRPGSRTSSAGCSATAAAAGSPRGPQQGADLAATRRPCRSGRRSRARRSRSTSRAAPSTRASPRASATARRSGCAARAAPATAARPAGDLVVTVQRHPAPRVLARRRQPAHHRARRVRRGRARRDDRGADARRRPPSASRCPRARRRARPARQGQGRARRRARATCWSPSRSSCPQRLTAAAREAVQAFGIATSGEDVRADLLDAAKK